MKVLIVLGVIVILALIFLYPGSSQIKTLYIVDATEQVIVTRFGEVKSVHRSSGLYAKAPFIDTVISFDRRILRIDAQPIAMPDKEKQNLVIDSYARYRITDPVQFRKTLRTEIRATSTLGDIVTSALRAEVAQRDRFEIIGAKPIPGVTDEGLPLFEGTESRSALLEAVVSGVRLRIEANEEPFGIEIVDVRIKRADFPDSVTPTIFTRMRAERNRIATRFRSEGDEEDLKIRADANKRREIILAEAERDGNRLRGQGEAEAIRILAERDFRALIELGS